MKLLKFGDGSGVHFKIAILIKESSMRKEDLQTYYVDPLVEAGIDPTDIVAIGLPYGANNKVTAKQAQQNLEAIFPILETMQAEFIYCADSTYFKQLVRGNKADQLLGLMMGCPHLEGVQVTYGLNHSSLVYNPAQQEKIDTSIQTLIAAMEGNYQEIKIPFTDERYPLDYYSIKKELESLHQHKELAVDIEAFSLKLDKAKLGTISFAESPTAGCAFPIDYYPVEETGGFHGVCRKNVPVRRLLKEFFESYQGKLVAHNSAYDFRILVWELWMEHPLDFKGMLKGIEILTRSFDDTKIIAYLALNTTAMVSYSLKMLGQPYAGNYGEEEIKDIRRIDLFSLLRYNLSDTCTTLWVKEKYYPIMVKDQQEEIYLNMKLPMQKVLLQTELHGMPMHDDRIQQVKQAMTKIEKQHKDNILNSVYMNELHDILRYNEMVKANAKLKVKQHPIEAFDSFMFNPNSGDQVAILLHEVMGLPVLYTTPTGSPKTDGDTLKDLINHAKTPEAKDIIQNLLDLADVSKVLSTFIPAFENGILKADGMRYLHGSFNIGGTKSGRLSSSDPNLQQLPSNSVYGPMIKYIFAGPPGKIMVGADFRSLEDYISALLSKDPNKIKVYTDGYDGHCLRAFFYFREDMPDIVDTVESINSIKKKYPKQRQDSKTPTFALTYGGTWKAIMRKGGFTEEKAKSIENSYHVMYEVSDKYTQRRIQEASRKGYAELAFGMRIRTPLLKNTVVGSRRAVKEAAGEGRTVGNAFGQSYGMLNDRAMIEFMERVWDSPYKYEIMPIAPIHDASYYIIQDDADTLKFVNDNLVECMAWQELPEIAHDEVKIGGDLDVFYPDWSNGITLKNYISSDEIIMACHDALKDYKPKVKL